MIEYKRWLSGEPSWYSNPGEMPRLTAIGFEYLISQLGRHPEGEHKNIHAEMEHKMKERMQQMQPGY